MGIAHPERFTSAILSEGRSIEGIAKCFVKLEPLHSARYVLPVRCRNAEHGWPQAAIIAAAAGEPSGEPHQFERRTAVGAVRIAKGLAHFEMVVVRRFDQFDGLCRPPSRRGEIAVLTLEFRRLVGAVGDGDRRAQFVELALRAHRLLHSSVNLT